MASDRVAEDGGGDVEGAGIGFGGGSKCWDSNLKVRVEGKGGEGLQRAMLRRAPVFVLRELATRWLGMRKYGKVRRGEEVEKLVKDEEIVGVIGRWIGEMEGKGVVVEKGGGLGEAKEVFGVFGGIRGVRVSVESKEALTKEVLEMAYEINLDSAGINADSMVVLSHAMSTPGLCNSLHTLRLWGNNFGAAGMAALAEALSTPASFPSLHTLHLGFNNIGDEGMLALSRALSTPDSCTSLHTLDLGYNNFGADGIEAFSHTLSTPGSLPSLHSLVLSSNAIGDEGLVALIHALETPGSCPSLNTLNLDENDIGANGMVALADTLSRPGSCPSLRTIIIGENDIGDEGMSAQTRLLQLRPALKIQH